MTDSGPVVDQNQNDGTLDFLSIFTDGIDYLSEIVPVASSVFKTALLCLKKFEKAKTQKREFILLRERLKRILTNAKQIAEILQSNPTRIYADAYLKEMQQIFSDVKVDCDLSVAYALVHVQTMEEKMDVYVTRMKDLFDRLLSTLLAKNVAATDELRSDMLKSVQNMKNLPSNVALEVVKVFQPILNNFARSDKEMGSIIGSGVYKKMHAIKTDTHVDEKTIQEFQTCIQSIVKPEDIMSIPSADLQMEAGHLLRSKNGTTGSVGRRCIMNYTDHEYAELGPVKIEVIVKTPQDPADLDEGEQFAKRFTREMWILYQIRHPNVVRLYGIFYEKAEDRLVDFGLVSKYYANSNLLEYIDGNKNVNRFKLLYDASKGIQHIHRCGVHHGNIKCSNIFIDENGIAAIGDFAKANIDTGSPYPPALWFDLVAPSRPSTEDWTAPERYDTDDHDSEPPSVASDIYSFGMTILECFTLRNPFHGMVLFQTNLEKLLSSKASLDEKRPRRPENNRWIDDSMWEFLRKCWADKPEDRPSIIEVMDILRDRSEKFEAEKKAREPEVASNDSGVAGLE